MNRSIFMNLIIFFVVGPVLVYSYEYYSTIYSSSNVTVELANNQKSVVLAKSNLKNVKSLLFHLEVPTCNIISFIDSTITVDRLPGYQITPSLSFSQQTNQTYDYTFNDIEVSKLTILSSNLQFNNVVFSTSTKDIFVSNELTMISTTFSNSTVDFIFPPTLSKIQLTNSNVKSLNLDLGGGHPYFNIKDNPMLNTLNIVEKDNLCGSPYINMMGTIIKFNDYPLCVQCYSGITSTKVLVPETSVTGCNPIEILPPGASTQHYLDADNMITIRGKYFGWGEDSEPRVTILEPNSFMLYNTTGLDVDATNIILSQKKNITLPISWLLYNFNNLTMDQTPEGIKLTFSFQTGKLLLPIINIMIDGITPCTKMVKNNGSTYICYADTFDVQDGNHTVEFSITNSKLYNNTKLNSTLTWKYPKVTKVEAITNRNTIQFSGSFLPGSFKDTTVKVKGLDCLLLYVYPESLSCTIPDLGDQLLAHSTVEVTYNGYTFRSNSLFDSILTYDGCMEKFSNCSHSGTCQLIDQTSFACVCNDQHYGDSCENAKTTGPPEKKSNSKTGLQIGLIVVGVIVAVVLVGIGIGTLRCYRKHKKEKKQDKEIQRKKSSMNLNA